MKLTTDQVEALVAAVLAVNNYRLEKVWAQLPGLRAGKLTDPQWVASADLGEVVVHLTASGHDRGMLAGLIADRLQTMMQAVVAGKLDALPAALKQGDQDAATKILCTVRGIGPKVAANAVMLMK
jgi:3-methyladenine DNA glycosylase/8-oxoguanine DNA glycosylase